MNIDSIKKKLSDEKGKTLHFKFNGARNQKEEFQGEIIKMYPAIFLIRVLDEVDYVKSFTYADVLIDTLEIDFSTDNS